LGLLENNAMDDEKAPVRLSVDEHRIATLTLNRPDKLNSFTEEMIEHWHRALRSASEHPDVNVIVLTGAGRAFCAGGELEDISVVNQKDTAGRKHYLWRGVHDIPLTLERTDKPVIAAINGAARGAGLDMALMCDIRIAAASATMAESYINLGLIAGDAGTWFLPRIVGPARALEMFWTGDVINATEAERIGLVNRVVPDHELMEATYSLARRIASQPQEAVRMFKRSVYQGLEMQRRTHLDMISSHMAILLQTDDHQKRLAEMLERKKR
jgi:enoyl-CoA hydratase/carnithine racemase